MQDNNNVILRDIKKRRATFVAVAKPTSFSKRRENGTWRHDNEEKKEEYQLPAFFNPIRNRQNTIKATCILLTAVGITENNGYIVDHLSGFKPIYKQTN